MTSSPRFIPVAEQARLIRAQLKRHFPGVKFSVRSSSYSGGASITVRWMDGPLGSDVEKITGPFKGGDFDGMIDMKYNVRTWLCPDGSVAYASSPGTEGSRGVHASYSEPAPCEGAELVSFHGDFVFLERAISPALATQAIARIAAYWGGVTEIPTAVPSQFSDGFTLEPREIGQRPPRPDLRDDWFAMVRQACADPSRFTTTTLAQV